MCAAAIIRVVEERPARAVGGAGVEYCIGEERLLEDGPDVVLVQRYKSAAGITYIHRYIY